MQSVETDPFDDFWTLYPRHVAKKDARKAWAKIPPRLYPQILEALVRWRPVWATKDPEFLPYPATWLNGERWDDELPRGISGPATAAHVPAKLPEVGVRTEMPDNVRQMLTRLRAA